MLGPTLLCLPPFGCGAGPHFGEMPEWFFTCRLDAVGFFHVLGTQTGVVGKEGRRGRGWPGECGVSTRVSRSSQYPASKSPPLSGVHCSHPHVSVSATGVESCVTPPLTRLPSLPALVCDRKQAVNFVDHRRFLLETHSRTHTVRSACSSATQRTFRDNTLLTRLLLFLLLQHCLD